MKVVNKKYWGFLIMVLVLIKIISLFLMYNPFSNKEVILDSVSLIDELKEQKMFAIMIEQEDGTYSESNNNTWPSLDIYTFDKKQSGCIDINGNKINGILSYDENTSIATVETSNTSYCYLYFRKPTNLHELCNGMRIDEGEGTSDNPYIFAE